MTDKPSVEELANDLANIANEADNRMGMTVSNNCNEDVIESCRAAANRLRELEAENNKLRATVVVADAERDGFKELPDEARAEVERLRNEARLLASRNRHLMQQYKELIAAQKYDEEDWQELLDERQNACIALCDCEDQAHHYDPQSHCEKCRYRAVMTRAGVPVAEASAGPRFDRMDGESYGDGVLVVRCREHGTCPRPRLCASCTPAPSCRLDVGDPETL